MMRRRSPGSMSGSSGASRSRSASTLARNRAFDSRGRRCFRRRMGRVYCDSAPHPGPEPPRGKASRLASAARGQAGIRSAGEFGRADARRRSHLQARGTTIGEERLPYEAIKAYLRSLSTAELRGAHLTQFFGGERAVDITPVRLRAYQAARLAEGAASATINRELAALHRMLRLAVKTGRLLPLSPPSRDVLGANRKSGQSKEQPAGQGTRSAREDWRAWRESNPRPTA